MEKRTKITVRDLNLYYGENHALKDVNMNIRENCVTAFIGPSGCGKSTFLKTLNRMNDLVDGVRITGEVKLDDEDIYAEGVDTFPFSPKIIVCLFKIINQKFRFISNTFFYTLTRFSKDHCRSRLKW